MKAIGHPDDVYKVSPAIPVIISLVIIGIDLVTPSQILLSIFFVVPVLIAAWFNSLRLAITISVALPLVRFIIATQLDPSGDPVYSAVNAADRLVLLCVVALVTSRLSESVKHLRMEVNVLERMIPICSNCKKIRDKDDVWQPLEKYMGEHSKMEFTHGICPDCMKLLYGKYMKSG